jgi:lycopene cyclase CruP
LQDVVQLGGLAQALWGVMRRDPWLVVELLPRLGLPELVEWAGHFGALGLYELLQRLADRPEATPQDYFWKRRREAWRYGCGRDHLS